MHQSFRDGFEKSASTEKTAWWSDSRATQPLRHPSIAAQRTLGKAKTVVKDVASGMGIGKGLMTKGLAGLTALDIFSRVGAAKTKSAITPPPASFFQVGANV
jgi:hypothetical protein